MSGGPKQTLQQGYDKFVVKNEKGCWGWKGCRPKNPGYGQFRHNMKLERAHRASWILHYGDIPKEMFVLHKCDNYECSNPEHLFLGTNIDNIKDMLKKGRHPFFGKSGETNHKSRYSVNLVRKIKELLVKNIPNIEIARVFNVRPQYVSKIKTKSIWSHL